MCTDISKILAVLVFSTSLATTLNIIVPVTHSPYITSEIKMKFTLATFILLAGLAVALPAGKQAGDPNAQQDAADAKVTAGQKADSNANAAANDGATVCLLPCPHTLLFLLR